MVTCILLDESGGQWQDLAEAEEELFMGSGGGSGLGPFLA